MLLDESRRVASKPLHDGLVAGGPLEEEQVPNGEVG